jgi:cytochrome b subunit of formate dehydrogenase
MLYVCFTTIIIYFIYALWYFYAFFGTNLLTKCHSASFLFYISEKLYKKYSWNWMKQKPKFLFSWGEDGVQSRNGGGPQGGHTYPRRGLALARA